MEFGVCMMILVFMTLFDSGIHIAMHSVLSLKPGVTTQDRSRLGPHELDVSGLS